MGVCVLDKKPEKDGNLSIVSHKYTKVYSNMIRLSCIHKHPHVATYSYKLDNILISLSV